MEMLPAILSDTGAAPARCAWHRAAALRTATPELVRVWAPPTAVARVDLMALVTLTAVAARSLPVPPEGRWPLVAQGRRVLAFASGSVLANARAGTACYAEMARIAREWVGRTPS
jgi:hypothetical protein